MIEIKENVNFRLEKVMAFKGRMTQEEFAEKMQGVIIAMQTLGLKPRDAIITGAGEKQPDGSADVEVLIPVTEPMRGLEGFDYLECFELKNAVNVIVSGSLMEFKTDMPKVDASIKEEGYTPATTKYVVMGKPTSQDPMTAVFRADVFFGT